jgi:hypothetical protein
MRIFNCFIFVFMVGFLSSCWVGRQTREQKAQEWIQQAKRPIKVIEHNSFNHFSASGSNRFYTLIDQEGKVFLADGVRFQLPPVIE